MLPYSLQDERSPALRDQRGPQLWRGRQGHCQSAGRPGRHSRQNHQQWPEEEKGNWLFGGVSGALCEPASLCWLPECHLERSSETAGFETLDLKQHVLQEKRKGQAGNMTVSFGSRGGEKLSKSQVWCFLGERQLQNEDSGIPSRRDSTLDREIDRSASRTGMKAMSVLRLCLWDHCNEDKWMKGWDHILF